MKCWCQSGVFLGFPTKHSVWPNKIIQVCGKVRHCFLFFFCDCETEVFWQFWFEYLVYTPTENTLYCIYFKYIPGFLYLIRLRDEALINALDSHLKPLEP